MIKTLLSKSIILLFIEKLKFNALSPKAKEIINMNKILSKLNMINI